MVENESVSADEVMKRVELTPEALSYCERFLLPERKGSEAAYSEEEVKTLEDVKRLRQLGLSLEEIRDLELPPSLLSEITEFLRTVPVDYSSPESCLSGLNGAISVLERHLTAVDRQREQLALQRSQLARRVAAFQKLLDRVRGRYEDTSGA
jgi:DNA-binding transcriptional MerR regulator